MHVLHQAGTVHIPGDSATLHPPSSFFSSSVAGAVFVLLSVLSLTSSTGNILGTKVVTGDFAFLLGMVDAKGDILVPGVGAVVLNPGSAAYLDSTPPVPGFDSWVAGLLPDVLLTLHVIRIAPCSPLRLEEFH